MIEFQSSPVRIWEQSSNKDSRASTAEHDRTPQTDPTLLAPAPNLHSPSSPTVKSSFLLSPEPELLLMTPVAFLCSCPKATSAPQTHIPVRPNCCLETPSPLLPFPQPQTWKTLMRAWGKLSNVLRRTSMSSKSNLPPKSCMPSRAKTMIKRKRRRSREAMERTELSREATRLLKDVQYLGRGETGACGR